MFLLTLPKRLSDSSCLLSRRHWCSLMGTVLRVKMNLPTHSQVLPNPNVQITKDCLSWLYISQEPFFSFCPLMKYWWLSLPPCRFESVQFTALYRRVVVCITGTSSFFFFFFFSDKDRMFVTIVKRFYMYGELNCIYRSVFYCFKCAIKIKHILIFVNQVQDAKLYKSLRETTISRCGCGVSELNPSDIPTPKF